MTGRNTKKIRKNVQRKTNKLKKLVDSFICCIIANQNSEEKENQSSTIVEEIHDIDHTTLYDTSTPKSVGEVARVDENSSGDQKQKNRKDDPGLNGVPVLQWSRFSKVYRYGLPVFLGEGDQGYVTLMKDSVTKKLVAVKTWHKDADTDVIIMSEMFKYELKAMVKFNGEKHFPDVIGILPNPDSAVCFSLVQEFIGDEKTKTSLSLAEYLEGKGERLTHQELISVTRDVAEALRTIHEKGWVHCDLKTDNVMLQETGQASPIIPTEYKPEGFWINEVPSVMIPNDESGVHAKMIDFGLAGPIGEAKMPLTFPKSMKKVVYQLFPQISPEVVKGLGNVPYSYESDIYSLGVLLKEVSSSGVQVLHKLSKKCMAKNPRKRPSISEVIDSLKEIQSL
ncbi:putative serine/threonine-protein kinase gdt4 [Holothuria leucospilota]|uniref:Serine/threonine-protein kinase gdt4 n=1 Tax=Holothuria leucospilota TaxID=206669 RepID=A0A9Q1CMH6_HOLLE|nr:putative serine/threonine-protein kinase gdt4 [Holothuria leucospilota]